MISLRVVFCTFPCIAIRRLRTQSSVGVLLGLLWMAVGISSLYYFRYFVPNTGATHQQPAHQNKLKTLNPELDVLTTADTSPVSSAKLAETLKKIDAVGQEKETLEKRVNDCQGEKKSLISSLDTEKQLHKKTNDTLTLSEQNIRQEKNKTERLIRHFNEERKMLEANVSTIHREFFNYASAMLLNTPYPGVDNYTRYTMARLGLLPLAGIEPLKPEYGRVINNVTAFGFPLTIPACRDPNTSAVASPSVFIAVISAPGNFDKRNGIRQTWRTHLSNVSYHNSSMVVAGFAFILGLTDSNATQIEIEEENKIHGDLIQIEMADFYRNLSLKVAGLFNWLYRHCLKVKFILKADDDVYVNVRNLAQFVQSFHESNQSMFGLSASHSLNPIRDGKWGITFEEWPWKDYPEYYLGPAVLFSGRTILPLLAAFQTTPMMPFDDIYVTGMCTEKAGINRTSFSSNYTTVYAMSQPVTPLACDLRRLISWLTVSATHMNSSHFATDDFYHNRTQCVIVAGSNGTNTTVDHNEPAQFHFV